MIILGIDPGPERSGWCVYSSQMGMVHMAGVDDNDATLERAVWALGVESLILERPVSYGAVVGESVLQTMRWAGRFEQAFLGERSRPVYWLSRPEVITTLTGSRSCSKGQVNAALRDLHPGSNDGQQRKGSPLYGLKSHAWDACAVAVAWNLRRDGE